MVDEYPTLLRSEEMSLCHFYIPQEVAHATVQEIASIGNVVEFNDLNPDVNPFQRHFVTALRRLDEIQRRLNFLTVHAKSLDIVLSEPGPLPDHLTSQQQIDALDPNLAQLESRISEMNASYETLERRMAELIEAREVLRECEGSFESAQRTGVASEMRQSFEDDSRPLLAGDDYEIGRGGGGGGGIGGGAGLGDYDVEFITGTVPRKTLATFERVLWRVLRGNLYMNHIEIAEPIREPTGTDGEIKEVHKNVFIIFAHGDELLAKIRKIAQSLGCTLYPVPKTAAERRNSLQEIHSRIDDLSVVLRTTSQTRRTELERVAESLNSWWTLTRRERLVYETMNLWKWGEGRRTLLAEGWVPSRDVAKVQGALRNASEGGGVSSTHPTAILHVLDNAPNPPTFHRTNKFTEGFQSLIDAYGIASYQEFNPGIVTIITFPFLFAVMFGDMGHGLIIVLSASFMVIYENKLKHVKEEIFGMFFYGRYILLLMGLFAIFTGFMYNDVVSLSLSIWKSGWNMEAVPGVENMAKGVANGRVYPVGLDPAWHGSDNYLLFTNSLKMKMSVILGVIHMTFALFCQVPNHLHFKHGYAIWAEFLPQLLFMECLFGYLIVTILYKWTVNWEESATGPPNLLNMLIYMFLSPGSVDPETQLYAGQSTVQVILLLIAVICIPWMLCAKPYVLYREHEKIKGQGYHSLGQQSTLRRSHDTEEGGNDEDRGQEDEDELLMDEMDGMNGSGGGSGGHKDEEEFDIGEIVIHQVIHTIEYCLGCISNTASYLRLWALSLAHAQLSEVLWNMTLKGAFGGEGAGGVVFLIIMFAAWFCLSVVVLCLMEGLSAFLHALRLHWVEANNKHYMGAGRQYTPVTFEGLDGEPK